MQGRQRSQWNSAVSRFKTETAAIAGRNSNRSAGVRTGGQRNHASGDCRGSASAGSARRAIRIPGVAGDTEKPVFGKAGKSKLRGIGFAHNNCAGCFEPRNLNRVAINQIVLERDPANAYIFMKRLAGMLGNRLLQSYTMISSSARSDLSSSFGTGQMVETAESNT